MLISLANRAFTFFAKANPDHAAFLIDTYDTEAAVQKVVDLAATLHARL